MNAVNTPDHLDVIVDAEGHEWKVRMEGGYTLIGKDGRVHETVNNRMPWHELVRWWNREHLAPIREAVMRSADLCSVTCGFCRHVDTLEAFTSTPVSGATAADVFQCPKCKRAVERQKGKTWDGMPDITLVEIGGAL